MIAKLERTQSNAQQNIEQTQSNVEQLINNNRTTTLERTVAYLGGGLLHFTGTKSVVVKTQTC